MRLLGKHPPPRRRREHRGPGGAGRPDPEDDNDPGDDAGYGERYLQLDASLDNAGRIAGDVTPECAAAVQAVLEALGKKRGPEGGQDAVAAVPRRPAGVLAVASVLRHARCMSSTAGADAPSQLRAGIYARLSETYDAAESVPTQLANGERHAERRGWVVAGRFKDDGFSAY
jgi:hypothetical protein